MYLRSELLHVRQYVLDNQGRMSKTRKWQLEEAYKQKEQKISICNLENIMLASIRCFSCFLTQVKRFPRPKLPVRCSQLSKAQRTPSPVQVQQLFHKSKTHIESNTININHCLQDIVLGIKTTSLSRQSTKNQ